LLALRTKPNTLLLHELSDSLNENGPTSLAAVKTADDNLNALRQALDRLGLTASTNIVIAADHGFSTISKQSSTSPAAKADYKDVPKGFLPPGLWPSISPRRSVKGASITPAPAIVINFRSFATAVSNR
jgi:Type I phosphodiesterase / nucleotide pyrophosphatase